MAGRAAASRVSLESPLWLPLAMFLTSVVIPVIVLRWRLRQRMMQTLLQEAQRRIAELLLSELRQSDSA